MQHHILCNISYVVIAESMRKSLKYTTNTCTIIAHAQKYRSTSYIHKDQNFLDPNLPFCTFTIGIQGRTYSIGILICSK